MLPSASSLAKAIARTTSQSALRLAVGISGRPNSIVQPATVLGRQLYSRYPASHTALGRSVHATLLKQPFGGQSAGMAAADSTVLSASQDTFDGIIIDAELLPHSEGEFYALLRRSLEIWRQQQKRGIWLKLPIQKASLVHTAVNAGFIFHHAEPDYLMLTHWLPATESTLPANASHQVGVGAFVLNEHQEVLCVQEAHGPLRGKGVWKLPTGLVNAGEDISDAAVREVLEETGIRASFEAVIAARQAHNLGVARNKSDMFFFVALRPELGQREVVPQESELAAAKWMPLQEYADLQFLQQRPLHSAVLDRCVAYAQGRYAGLQGFKLAGGLRHEPELLLAGDPAPAADPENSSRL